MASHLDSLIVQQTHYGIEHRRHILYSWWRAEVEQRGFEPVPPYSVAEKNFLAKPMFQMENDVLAIAILDSEHSNGSSKDEIAEVIAACARTCAIEWGAMLQELYAVKEVGTVPMHWAAKYSQAEVIKGADHAVSWAPAQFDGFYDH